jgi:chorismate mutase
VAQINMTKPEAADPAAEAQVEEEVAYLSKRHRVSPAIVQEIIRRTGTSERSAVEREIRKGMARR